MKKSRSDFFLIIQTILTLAGVLAVFLPIFFTRTPWPLTARDFLEANGQTATGAQNLVSAIYLGYRAFDTLGETIVLLVAVSGTIGIISHSGRFLARGFGDTGLELETGLPETPRMRTDLLDVVTGKLGPIVLLFGLYVMLFGHLSPGGGFQGGVVIASGIVFLSLGSKRDSARKFQEARVLSGIEALAFLLLVSAGVSGIPLGVGLFGNPISADSVYKVGYIILLNSLIGLKVGAGIAFMCVAMLDKDV